MCSAFYYTKVTYICDMSVIILMMHLQQPSSMHTYTVILTQPQGDHQHFTSPYSTHIGIQGGLLLLDYGMTRNIQILRTKQLIMGSTCQKMYAKTPIWCAKCKLMHTHTVHMYTSVSTGDTYTSILFTEQYWHILYISSVYH